MAAAILITGANRGLGFEFASQYLADGWRVFAGLFPYLDHVVMLPRMTFTDKQQKEHRKAFIHECRQKAWGALCHAEWISKNLDDLLALYQKFQAEDNGLAASIKEAETAIDHHTVENRTKRKAMQERRNKLAQDMKALGENIQRGQQSLAQIHQSVEINLALATAASPSIISSAR